MTGCADRSRRQMAIPWGQLLIVVAISLGSMVSPCVARDIYVDNRTGNNRQNGALPKRIEGDIGPVRTIARALQLANSGDTIVLAQNERPYRESIQLIGRRHSGAGDVPFRIIGNGAVLSGAEPVPMSAWRGAENDLWTFTPWRKGTYQLRMDGKPLPRFPLTANHGDLKEIPIGQWTVDRGKIYYRGEPLADVPGQSFDFAARGVGITLRDVHDVSIENLTVECFRIDGVNASGSTDNCVLQDVISRHHGRSGVYLMGTADVFLRNCTLRDSAQGQLTISQFGLADVVDCDLSEPPLLVD